MMIRVLCADKTRGFVEDYLLEDYIRGGKVIAFFRPGSNEWVDVKRDSIRGKRNASFTGPERRSKSRTRGRSGEI